MPGKCVNLRKSLLINITADGLKLTELAHYYALRRRVPRGAESNLEKTFVLCLYIRVLEKNQVIPATATKRQ